MATDQLGPVPQELQSLGPAARSYMEKLRQLLTNAAMLNWSVLDFTGSKLSDIETRPHSDLQSIEGADEGNNNTDKNKHVSNAQLKTLYDFIGNANLSELAALVGTADRFPYFDGPGSLALAVLTASAREKLASDFYHYYEADFIGVTTVQGPFVGSAINTGTTAFSGNFADHPGYAILRSAAVANSGYRFSTSSGPFRIGGSEQYDCCLMLDTLANCTFRLGYLDTIDVTDSDDGFYIEIPSTGNAVGKTADNTVRSTTGTIATLVTGVWYHARITMNAAMNSVTFELFNEAGASLGSQSLATNIPGTGRNFGAGLVATESVGVTADLVRLDYMAIGFKRKFQRGNF